MSGATVVQLRVRTRPESLTPEAPRVVAAFSNALLRSPPKPCGFAACVGYLQEEATQLQSRNMGMRALETLRSSLFMAPGREAEMALLWREALATACFARVVAVQTRFEGLVPLENVAAENVFRAVLEEDFAG